MFKESDGVADGFWGTKSLAQFGLSWLVGVCGLRCLKGAVRSALKAADVLLIQDIEPKNQQFESTLNLRAHCVEKRGFLHGKTLEKTTVFLQSKMDLF